MAANAWVEGQLAAAVGDYEAARRALTHYLTLRTDPDSFVVAQVDSARTLLGDVLEAGGFDRP